MSSSEEVSGPYDVIVRVETTDAARLTDDIVPQIQKVDGITDTDLPGRRHPLTTHLGVTQAATRLALMVVNDRAEQPDDSPRADGGEASRTGPAGLPQRSHGRSRAD